MTPTTSAKPVPTQGVRKVRANLRSTTGYVAGQDTESSLEMDFCALARFDLAVERFVSQPVKIVYVDREDRERFYTPDVLLIPHRSQNGVFLKRPMLCEIKFAKDLASERDVLAEKFEAARVYCAQQDWDFRVFSEKEIRGPFLANAKFLLPFRVREFAPEQIARVMVWFGNHGVATVEQYIEQHEETALADLACVWHLLATGKLVCDLNRKLSNHVSLWRTGPLA